MTHRQPNDKSDTNRGAELVRPPEAHHALERAVRQFCKTHPCPYGYSPDGWKRPAAVGRRGWGWGLVRPFVVLLMVLQLILPLWASDTVQFPPDYYTYPEIAKRLSVGGRTVVCARSLQERLALVALRPRGWEEAVALLSRGLDIRVRLVDEARQVWQMEPEPQQVAFEEEVYATWQRVVEEEFRQRWEVLFSLQLSEGDWQVLEELVQWVRLQQEHSSEWALSDLPVELGRLSAGLRGWLDRVSSLPRGLYRELFGRWLVDREARQRYALYWLVSNRRGDADMGRALILSLLSSNRGRLVPDWREAVEGVVSRRVLRLGEAVMSPSVQHRLLSLWGLASAQQLSSCYISVNLYLWSIYECRLIVRIGKCVPISEHLSPVSPDDNDTYIFDMISKNCSFEFFLPVFASKEMDNSLSIERRAERFLEGLSEELGRRWREYQVREEQLLRSPMAQRSFECYSLPDPFTLSGLLLGWSLATQSDVVMEIFPARDQRMYLPVDDDDLLREYRAKLSLQELLERYIRSYHREWAQDWVSYGRLLFYESEGVLFAYNPHSFMERRLGLPLATAKTVLLDLGREPLERIREYHRRTSLVQNVKATRVAVLWGLQKVLMIDGAARMTPPRGFTDSLPDIWLLGELLKGVDLFGLGKMSSRRVEIEIEQLPKSFLELIFLWGYPLYDELVYAYACGFHFERLSGKLVIEVSSGVDWTREEEVKKYPWGLIFRYLWRAGIEAYSFDLRSTGLEKYDTWIRFALDNGIGMSFYLPKYTSSDRR